MTGNAWLVSDMLDDEDIEFMQHEFVTYKQAAQYYRLGEKPLVRLSRLSGAAYKIGRRVLIKRSIFEEYMREHFVKDVGFTQKEFFDVRTAKEFYGMGEKVLLKLAREAGAVYKINYQHLIIRRDVFEGYMLATGIKEDKELWDE